MLCRSCYSLILEQVGKFAAGHAVQVLGDLQQDDESSPGKNYSIVFVKNLFLSNFMLWVPWKLHVKYIQTR